LTEHNPSLQTLPNFNFGKSSLGTDTFPPVMSRCYKTSWFAITGVAIFEFCEVSISNDSIMTVVHIGMHIHHVWLEVITDNLPVLFKFRSTTTDLQQTEFVKAAKQLRLLGCVKDGRLIIQRGSITKPIAKSKGYEAALVSFHHDATAVDVYQDSPEHEKYEPMIRRCDFLS